MSDNPIASVYALLLALRGPPMEPSHTPRDHILSWFPNNAEGERHVARVCANIADLVDAADALIGSANISERAKTGLLQTTSGIRNAFYYPNVVHSGSVSNHLPALDAQITGFSLLTSAYRIEQPPKPPEVDDLVADVDAMIVAFKHNSLDPVVSGVARRHLTLLATMLRHIEVFGVTSALATYYEMMLRLRDAGEASSPAAATAEKFWPTLQKWSSRLKLIKEAYDTATKGVGHVSKALAQLPDLTGLGN